MINLPTTLRLPLHKGDFHLTHRFEGNLRDGSFTDQLSNFFGVDVGAALGLEYRFGLMRHLQAVVLRTNRARAIQFSAKYDAWHQSDTRPVSISGIVSIEGDNNFGANSGNAPSKNYAPAVGVVISREIATQLALYAMPYWVANTGIDVNADGNTGVIGLGFRVRFGPNWSNYFSAEVSPRIGGFVIGGSGIWVRDRETRRRALLRADVHQWHVQSNVSSDRSRRRAWPPSPWVQPHPQVLLRRIR